MSLPTAQEINPIPEDLDGQIACKHFFGKTLDDVEVMLHDEPHIYEEDLMWMGPVAFCFYIPAVIRLLRSESGTECGSLVAWFAIVLESRLEYDHAELSAVAKPLAEVCGHLVENWVRFASATEPYGDVRSRYEALRLQFSEMC